LANKCHDTLQYLLHAHASHPEWIAVAAFYKAVNVVEALFDDKHGWHSNGHTERLDKLRRLYPNIHKHFNVLYGKSLIARYLSDSTGVYKCFTDHLSADQVVTELVGRRLQTVEQIAETHTNLASLKKISSLTLPVLSQGTATIIPEAGS